MAVTEIALLSVKQNPSNQDPTVIAPELRENLRHAISEQASFSGHPVALLQSQRDPSLIFLVGGWDTMTQHMEDWVPGPINQGLLKLLGERIDVKWMFHLNVEPRGPFDVVCGVDGRDDAISAIGWYVIRDGQRSAAEALLRESRDESDCKDLSGLAHGWRLDLGFVADGNGSGLYKFANTVVLFGSQEIREHEQSVYGRLEGIAGEGKHHPVKLIDLVN